MDITVIDELLEIAAAEEIVLDKLLLLLLLLLLMAGVNKGVGMILGVV